MKKSWNENGKFLKCYLRFCLFRVALKFEFAALKKNKFEFSCWNLTQKLAKMSQDENTPPKLKTPKSATPSSASRLSFMSSPLQILRNFASLSNRGSGSTPPKTPKLNLSKVISKFYHSPHDRIWMRGFLTFVDYFCSEFIWIWTHFGRIWSDFGRILDGWALKSNLT